MKQQIDKLVELSKEYVEFEDSIGIGKGWNILRGNYGRPDVIKIYMESNNVWAVVFGNVEVSLYSNMIELPYNFGAIELHEIYEDAKQFLETLKNELEEKRKEEKIAELENELKKLKGEL